MYVDTCEARVASRAVYGRVRGACVYLRLEAATAEVDHAFVACAASPGRISCRLRAERECVPAIDYGRQCTRVRGARGAWGAERYRCVCEGGGAGSVREAIAPHT